MRDRKSDGEVTEASLESFEGDGSAERSRFVPPFDDIDGSLI
jgi:hypothetical protein